MKVLAPVLKQSFFDTNGKPLAGGQIYSFTAGTTTPQATYADSSGDTPNANPVILDANGQADIWIGRELFKFVIEDSLGNVLYTEDDVSIADPEASMPEGGSAGQVLTKLSTDDNDASWQTPPGSGGENQVLSGSTDPSGGIGIDGDFYINTTSHFLFGPKATGSWPSGVSLVGPAGADGTDGTDGTNGTNGTNGNTILSGSGAPSGGTGNNGDFYIDTTAWNIYGPKAAGAWGSGTSIIGPSGASAAPVITGSRGSPSNIVAITGIAFTGSSYVNVWFVQGNGAPVTVTANPRIAAGSLVGQRLTVIQRSASNTLTFADGNGLQLFGGSLVLDTADAKADFFWDGTNWVLEL